MKRQLTGMIGLLVLSLLLGAGFTPAQSFVNMNVGVPFDFMVGKTVFPAGKYRLDRYRDVSLWRIESEDGSTSVLVFTGSRRTRNIQEKGKLTFNKYGSTYFLSEITTPGTSRTAVLSKPDLEQELAVHRKVVLTSILVEP